MISIYQLLKKILPNLEHFVIFSLLSDMYFYMSEFFSIAYRMRRPRRFARSVFDGFRDFQAETRKLVAFLITMQMILNKGWKILKQCMSLPLFLIL